ncbi:formate dehydrogenase accessory sulfurtransferase FdhD [Acidisoma sp. C75]
MTADYRIPSARTSAESPLAQEIIPAAAPSHPLFWSAGAFRAKERRLAEETPVALTYNRVTHAVMMTTPADFVDFARGFTLNERIVERPEEIEEIEVVPAPRGGVELRLWITPARMEALDHRRRNLTGAMGCGLCGLDSLEEAMRPLPAVPRGLRLAPQSIAAAIAALWPAQALGRETRAVHAAGFWTAAGGLLALREDVGRHNALDKLAGALAGAGQPASAGVVVMTSRVSIELIQKAAVMGVQILAAVSAPSLLALREAEACGLTLVAIAREDGFEIFTHAERILGAGEIGRGIDVEEGVDPAG